MRVLHEPGPQAEARAVRMGAFIACFAASAAVARADGAFADSKTLLLPRTRPHRIITSSDVPGLLVSEDDGASWSWICEEAIGRFAALFQLGPAPDEQLYAITQAGLSISSDAGCSWHRPDGITKRAGDVFPDPNDAQHVLSTAATTVASDSPVYGDIVVQSHDGGASFGGAMFSTTSASITGVEQARSDPSRIYLAMSTLERQHPYLVRSTDWGESWNPIDLTAQLERRPLIVRILTVDPDDAQTLYIRLSDGTRDALAISHDGGDTLQVAQQLETSMSAFLLRPGGTLIVANTAGQSFRSADGGESFGPWTDASNKLHIQALAERDGVLYATTTSREDGFAVVVSHDDAEHWRPLLRLDHLRGPLACGAIGAECATQWTQLQPRLKAVSGPALDPDPTAALAPSAHGCAIGQGPGPDSQRAHSWWLCAAVLRRRRDFRSNKTSSDGGKEP